MTHYDFCASFFCRPSCPTPSLLIYMHTQDFRFLVNTKTFLEGLHANEGKAVFGQTNRRSDNKK